MDSVSLEGIVIFFLIFIGVILIAAFIYWLLMAIGLHMYANKQNIEKTWIAWIPIVQNFYLLHIYDVKFKPNFKLLCVGFIILGASILLSYTGFPIPLGIPIVMGYAMFWLFKRHNVNIVLQMVLMIITLGLTIPFQLMYLSGRQVHHQYIEEVDDDFFDEPHF